MYLFVLVIQILLAVGITVLVLLQRSEGGMGGLTGQSANSFLTARQAGNALSRLTKWFFVLFCIATISLMIMARNANNPQQVSLLNTTEQGE
jgi:preprotein translocase subunit SecG